MGFNLKQFLSLITSPSWRTEEYTDSDLEEILKARDEEAAQQQETQNANSWEEAPAADDSGWVADPGLGLNDSVPTWSQPDNSSSGAYSDTGLNDFTSQEVPLDTQAYADYVQRLKDDAAAKASALAAEYAASQAETSGGAGIDWESYQNNGLNDSAPTWSQPDNSGSGVYSNTGLNDFTSQEVPLDTQAYADYVQRLKDDAAASEIIANIRNSQYNGAEETGTDATGGAGNSQGFGLSGAVSLGKFAADAAERQSKRFTFVTPRKNPSPGSQYVVPGTVKVDTSPTVNGKGVSSADDIFKFRLNNGQIEITGEKHLLENGGLNKLQKATVEALDGAELPTPVANLLKNSDDLVKASKVVKNGGKALGYIGLALDTYEVADAFYKDWQDEDKKLGKKAYKAVAAVSGSWAGGWAGAHLGAMGGAAIGTLLCPGIGTAIGGYIGGVAGGWVGSTAGKATGAYFADNTYHGK